MTYISKKEKVFDLPEQDETSTTSLIKSEIRLKSFPSVTDRRAWTTEECQRYQHFYGLVNGSEPNISKSSSFKYIPFDVLLAILMAEKDAYIQELLDRQEKSSGDKLYRAEGFEDSDDDREALIRKDAQVVALKNKISGLESELEDYRETLTKAMTKLEKMDAVLNENNLLREKIKYSEETIKCLEEAKAELENDLEYYKKTFDMESDWLEKRPHFTREFNMDGGDCEDIVRLSSERDLLIQQVETLQKELERARTNVAEMEVLRKISQTTSSSLEEISKENEYYKKKLDSMKFLEKHIEELKKQAHTLTEKYKKESQKANDHLRQIDLNAKELEVLREERLKLQKRVSELSEYETQYMTLQSKLRQVELIIDENEILNKKLIQLDRLELENEQLKMRIEELKRTEMRAVEDKEKIMELQCALVEQDEEIKKMLQQIEELSQGYMNKNELLRLKNELEEKNGKLKQCEKQLAEIPILEAEIDELKGKLQKCIEAFKVDKDLLKCLQDELETCRARCHELEELTALAPSRSESTIKAETSEEQEFLTCGEHTDASISFADKAENTLEVPKQDANSQCKGIEVTERGTEASDFNSQIRLIGELGEQNQMLKCEVEILRSKLTEIDLDDLLYQAQELKELLHEKEEKIVKLEAEIIELQKDNKDFEEIDYLKERLKALEDDLKHYKDISLLLEDKLKLHEEALNEARELRNSLEKERKARELATDSLEKEKKAREFALNLVREMEEKIQIEEERRNIEESVKKLHREEMALERHQAYIEITKDAEKLKQVNSLSKTLIQELKTENKILLDMHNDFKSRQNIFIRKLKAEVEALRSLSKPEVQYERESLQEKVKNMMKETNSLVSEIEGLKSNLEYEKKAKDFLEKEVIQLQAELAACLTAGNEVFSAELEQRDAMIAGLERELSDARSEIDNLTNDALVLREDNAKLVERYSTLKLQHENMEIELNNKLGQIEELSNIVKSQEERYNQSKEHENCKEEAVQTQEETKEPEDLPVKVAELENMLKAKTEEFEKSRREWAEATNELNRLSSENSVLRCRLSENLSKSDVNFEKDLEEKYALEETLRKAEKELDKFKTKLTDDKDKDEELESTKINTLEKIAVFETSMEDSEKKQSEFENLKQELEELRAEKQTQDSEEDRKTSAEFTNLRRELEEYKKELENLKTENGNLSQELEKVSNLLEVCKKLQKTIPQNNGAPPTNEFFTPPTVPSPRSLELLESKPDDQVMMSVETHKKEINNLENEYKAKMEQLKSAGEKKIRKLIMQYEKEEASRNKKFNDTVNTIKSNYESDIKKLVEKHKSSIMRLQGLHEDEVQELNTNYETQMEAMQTQNENVINDLRTESSERCKQMTELHNREIKELEAKYEEILRDKEAQYLAEKLTVESSLDHSTRGIKEVHKEAVDSLTQFYQNSILELEEKHGKEMKKCKKNNLKRIELMKNKYEDLLVEERKKYEEQLEELLIQLKSGQQGDSPENKIKKYKQEQDHVSDSRLEFFEVLQKILNEGLESLSFEELVLVHSKTCFLPESIEEAETGGGEEEGIRCKHRMFMGAEKEELLKRIFTLEHQLVIKQLETQEAIVAMEEAEKYRVQELKDALVAAQEKNEELNKMLSNQSKLQMDLKIERYMLDRQAALHETNVVEKVKELEKKKAEKKRLEEELQKEKANVRHLTATLEAEKERHRSQRRRDAEYVESIRLRLEEALSHEHMMETQLDYEARFRAKLESELQALQKNFNILADFPSVQLQLETKAVKDIKNLDQCDTTKEEIHNRSRSKHRSKSRTLHRL